MDSVSSLAAGASIGPGANNNDATEVPLAEYMFNHKKLVNLEQGVAKLQKTTREQVEVTAVLQRHMSDTVSETDLRRALGLALQEFESRLVEAFQDSNRRCITLFAKHDDLTEMQGKIDKKVNCADHNAVLQRLSELKRYIDTMAESIFIGHLDALNSEFAKKADSAVVDEALKSKVDIVEVSEVRGRLERLEAIVNKNDLKLDGGLQDLRDDVTTRNAQNIARNKAMIGENKALINKIVNRQDSHEERMSTYEEQITWLTQEEQSLSQTQASMQECLDEVVLKSQERLSNLINKLDVKSQGLTKNFTNLEKELGRHQSFSGTKFQELFAEGASCKDQLKFLMDAVDNIKRRARELNKTHTAQYRGLSGEEDGLCKQLAALERTQKGHERDLKALERRAAKPGPNEPAFAQMALQPAPDDPDDRLRDVLVQLEKIASPESKPQRPPLPYDSKKAPLEDGAPALRHQARSGPAPIDSVRAHGACGLSPRMPLGALSPGVMGSAAGWANAASRRARS